ncbi:MAG: uncharacterized protein PWP23_1294 [Candidatus Sumerlaeota bacterium]|nr:uncharacterized protein [Candidatus Sumerlaeota bacterium]
MDDGMSAEDQIPEQDPLDRIVRIGQLIDLYGGLLTERQHTFIQLHYEEDLSFGEIAKTYEVSRQAIHDAVKHAEKALDDYEEKLRLLDRGYTKTGDGSEAASGSPNSGSDAPPPPATLVTAARETVGQLRELEDRLRRSGGIIYNADGVVRELGEIAQRLDGVLPPQ